MLLVKDFRVFRRDPVQWSQFLVFFGLLGLYFLNMDRFSQRDSDINYRTWVNMVSFLNLVVVGLILSTFTTRFIYPMISLEGSRFWILGLLPLQRDTIVWSKFLFAAGGSWIPCAVLVLLSDLLLRVSLTVMLVHQLTCVLLCVGLASIAVGLGASMPDVREDSPSKIAAGFGGTLNLVLSATYILAVTLLTALPVHFYAMAVESGIGAWLAKFSLGFWLTVGLASACTLAAIAVIFPLRSGLRSFRDMEF
jgi:ABC-2 type transport system permease protein